MKIKMKIMMMVMMMMIMTIVSVEQRPGWGELVFSNLGILQYLTCKSKIETDACKVLVFQVCSLGIPKPQPRIAAVTISISGPSCGAVPRHGILRGQPGAQR